MSQLNLQGPVQQKSGIARALGGLAGFREGTTILIILILGAVMAFLSPVFLTGENFSTMFKIFVINGWVVIAMTLVLISGGIDLSVAAVMAFVGVVAGQLFLVYHWNIWIASLAGVGVGVFVGFVNGFFITRVGLSPFIVTLAMSQIARGTAYVFSEAMPLPLNNVPASFKFIGRGIIGHTGVQFVIVLFIVVAILFDFLARRSTILRKVYYIGSNEKSARFSGINVNRVRMGVYVLSGLLAAIAGILAIARFSSAPPYGYQGVELDAISAAVIGGTSMNGGEGTVLGAVLGIVLLALIQTAINLLGVSPYWSNFVTGAILLVAVSVDFLTHRKRA
ncbi:MAG: ABC transporter permease [Spirochaetia bacterium]